MLDRTSETNVKAMIKELYDAGKTPKEIAIELNGLMRYEKIISTCGFLRRSSAKTVNIAVPVHIWAKATEHAAKRNISVSRLAGRIFLHAIQGKLVDAILDDGK